MKIRENLKNARIEKELKQKEVGKAIGISERSYWNLEHAASIGSVKVWDKLSDFFGVDQKILREVKVKRNKKM